MKTMHCTFYQITFLVLSPLIAPQDSPWDNIRLPEFIKPERYDIEIRPNFETLLVEGSAKLTFHVKEGVKDFIIFHSKNMSLSGQNMGSGVGVGIKQMSDANKWDQVLKLLTTFLSQNLTGISSNRGAHDSRKNVHITS